MGVPSPNLQVNLTLFPLFFFVFFFFLFLGKPYFGSGKVEKIVLNFTYIKLGRLIFCFLTFGKEEEEEEENILGLAKIGKAKNGKTHQFMK